MYESCINSLFLNATLPPDCITAEKKESIHFIKSAFWIWIEATSTAMQKLIHVLVVRCALRVLQASSLKLSSLYLALQWQSVDCRSSSEAHFLLSVYCTMRGEPLVNSIGFPGPLYIVRLMFLPDWTEFSFYQERLKRKILSWMADVQGWMATCRDLEVRFALCQGILILYAQNTAANKSLWWKPRLLLWYCVVSNLSSNWNIFLCLSVF